MSRNATGKIVLLLPNGRESKSIKNGLPFAKDFPDGYNFSNKGKKKTLLVRSQRNIRSQKTRF